MKSVLFSLFLFLSISSFGQTVKWIKDFDTSNQGSPDIKTDSTGNTYLYNSLYTGVNANILKLDKNGNQLWSIKMVDPNLGVVFTALYIAIDSAQNVYGFTNAFGYSGFELQATNGNFHIGPTSYNSDLQLVAFKLDKNGKYLWSSTVGCNTATLNGISYDKYTNMVYPIASYTMFLNSSFGNLTSPATQNSDLTAVSFFWAVDGNTGATKALKNLYVGQAGTIIPLPDRISYFTSNMYTEDVSGNYLQIDYNGNIHVSKPISLSMLSSFQATDVSSAYYYDTGVTSNRSVVGFYDFRNRIRKFDLYGNSVNETDFSMFDTIRQQKVQVFSTSGIKAVDDKNILFYGTNIDSFKTYFLGDSLSTYDFRLVFMDENFNINKNIHCNSTSSFLINSFNYSKSDSSFYFLLTGNKANTINIGSAIINIPAPAPNTNYTYLLNLKFDNVTLISDKQPAILSMVFDQQSESAVVNDSLATVTSVALPGTNLSYLKPAFILSSGTKFKNSLSSALDLTNPLVVTLMNNQGIERDWTIKVIKTGNKNNIDTVSFPQQLSYIRDTIKKNIYVLVDRTVDLHNTGFINFKADSFTTVSPDPNSIKDFSNPQIFNVTADNGDLALWTITVNRKLSNANDILSLQLTNEIDSAHINDINRVVTIRSNVLKTSIKSIKLSGGATLVSPINNIIDFTNPVTFEIQAENGDIADWQVNVTELPFSGLDVVKVYPNPVVNTLNVYLDLTPESPVSVNFLSVFGGTVATKTTNSYKLPSFSIDVSSYPSGVYLLNIMVAGHVYTKKIIITR